MDVRSEDILPGSAPRSPLRQFRFRKVLYPIRAFLEIPTVPSRSVPDLGRQNGMHFVNCHETSAPTVEFESYSLRWLTLNDRVHQTRRTRIQAQWRKQITHKVMMDLRVRQKDQLLRIHNRVLTSMFVQKVGGTKTGDPNNRKVARKLLNSIGAR